MKILQVLLVCGICASSINAGAEEASQRKAAAQLLAIMNSREVMISAFTSSLGPLLARVPEDKKEEVKAVFLKFAGSIADSPELKDRMVAVYEAAFSEAELSELLAFYSTPVGKKALAKMPELMQKGAIIGQEIAQSKQAEFQAELMQAMKGDPGKAAPPTP